MGLVRCQQSARMNGYRCPKAFYVVASLLTRWRRISSANFFNKTPPEL